MWIVEYCDCIYESAPQLVSVHRRAVDAFEKMRKLRDEKTDWETWEALTHTGYFINGEASGIKPRSYKGGKNDWYYRIRKVDYDTDLITDE